MEPAQTGGESSEGGDVRHAASYHDARAGRLEAGQMILHEQCLDLRRQLKHEKQKVSDAETLNSVLTERLQLLADHFDETVRC